MARYYTSINSFAEAEAFYNKIVPLRGAKNKDKDIRPLGDRRRKWERIVKVSNNCYALTSGWHPGESDYWMRDRAADGEPPISWMAKYSPIVWRRHKDGTETVTLRNGTGPGPHNSVYAFLQRYVPRYMHFIQTRAGHQHIHVRGSGNGTDYYLAKGRTIPKQYVARASKYDLGREWYQTTDDKAPLTFKVLDGHYELVCEAMTVPKPPKKRVDKTRKAVLKPHIDAFRDWAIAILPMMPTDWQSESEVLNQARTVPIGDFRIGYSVGWAFNAYNSELAEQIIQHDQHALRVLLALNMRAVVRSALQDKHGSDTNTTHLHLNDGFQTAYNRWANKTLGLINTVKGDAE